MRHKDPKTFVVIEVWDSGVVEAHGPYRQETAQAIAYVFGQTYAHRTDVKLYVRETVA